MPSWTYTRDEAKQTCPEFVTSPLTHLELMLSANSQTDISLVGSSRYPATHQFTALSRSASSKTTAGLLPPSSRVHRLRLLFAARVCTVLPVGTLPVKLTFAISMWLAKMPPVLPFPGSTWNTPGGNPASMASFPISAAAKGVFSLGFMMITLPAAKAGAVFSPRTPVGPFHGRILLTS